MSFTSLFSSQVSTEGNAFVAEKVKNQARQKLGGPKGKKGLLHSWEDRGFFLHARSIAASSIIKFGPGRANERAMDSVFLFAHPTSRSDEMYKKARKSLSLYVFPERKQETLRSGCQNLFAPPESARMDVSSALSVWWGLGDHRSLKM